MIDSLRSLTPQEREAVSSDPRIQRVIGIYHTLRWNRSDSVTLYHRKGGIYPEPYFADIQTDPAARLTDMVVWYDRANPERPTGCISLSVFLCQERLPDDAAPLPK